MKGFQIMIDLINLISLIGKSERDSNVLNSISDIGFAPPLKRPKKGDDEINLVSEDGCIELAFKFADSIPEIAKNFFEGELVLYALFVRPFAGINQTVILPFGLNFGLSRNHLRGKLGKPSWSSPVLNNDRWIIDGIKILICFEDDENSIREIVFSRNQW